MSKDMFDTKDKADIVMKHIEQLLEDENIKNIDPDSHEIATKLMEMLGKIIMEDDKEKVEGYIQEITTLRKDVDAANPEIVERKIEDDVKRLAGEIEQTLIEMKEVRYTLINTTSTNKDYFGVLNKVHDLGAILRKCLVDVQFIKDDDFLELLRLSALANKTREDYDNVMTHALSPEFIVH